MGIFSKNGRFRGYSVVVGSDSAVGVFDSMDVFRFRSEGSWRSPFTPITATITGASNTTTDTTIGGVLYRIHTFNESGDFIVSDAGSAGEVEYLIVGGGGSGGTNRGGGGGAGGVLNGTIAVSVNTHAVVIGSGGASSPTDYRGNGNKGEDSSVFSLTAEGGGFGSGDNNNGGNGGSGGGGDHVLPTAGGSGNAGPPRQGNDGGSGTASTRGGGGGGASQVGSSSGDGGDGIESTISGVSSYYGGGGGGGAEDVSSRSGGLGGGGAGAGVSPNTVAVPGVDGTGGGGGGGTDFFGGGVSSELAGAAGGDGIVIIRYPLQAV